MGRKSKAQMAVQAARSIKQAVWRVGAYLRLSVENSGGKTEDSIENQRAAVLALIDTQQDMRLHDVYCDNGETGTNFDRPSFERLMTDLRAGTINCVVVKDLSRFGRNYLEAGTLLEQTFPAMGVRFVAINDAFDTLTSERSTEGYIIPLRNILNDIYAKDISLKTGSALKIKQQQGDFIGAWAAYGYRKDKQNRRRLVVDEPVAALVRQMFAWKAEGMGNAAIAREMTRQGIPSPSAYRYQLGIVKQNSLSAVPWRANTVKSILQNEVYLGRTVQGRRRASLYQGQKQRHQPREQWLVVEGTHPALVEQALFDAVQAVMQGRSAEYEARQKRSDPVICAAQSDVPIENPLRGLLFCGCCGSPLTRHKGRNRQKNGDYKYYYEYICPNHVVNCIFMGTAAKPLLQALEQVILAQLAVWTEPSSLPGASAQVRANANKVTAREKALQEQLAGLRDERKQLFVELSQRKMDEAQFSRLQQDCKAEIEQRQMELEALCEERQREVATAAAARDGSEILRQMLEQGISGELARLLIDKVIVGTDKTLDITFRHRGA